MKNAKNDEFLELAMKLIGISRTITRSWTYKGTGSELKMEPFLRIEMVCKIETHG